MGRQGQEYIKHSSLTESNIEEFIKRAAKTKCKLTPEKRLLLLKMREEGHTLKSLSLFLGNVSTGRVRQLLITTHNLVVRSMYYAKTGREMKKFARFTHPL